MTSPGPYSLKGMAADAAVLAMELGLTEFHVELAPDARMIVIENSRHAIPVECPEAFNAALLDFLGTYDRSSRSSTALQTGDSLAD